MADKGRDCILLIFLSKYPEDQARNLLVIQSTGKPNNKIPSESQNIAMKTNIRVLLKPKHEASKIPFQVLSPQELQTAYEELLITFSDPLTSATEFRLVDQLMESYENNKVLLSADTYVELFN